MPNNRRRHVRRLQQNQQRNRRVALLQRDKTQANNESIKFKNPNLGEGPIKEMDMTPRGFGLPKKLWRQLLKYRNKTVDKCASDEMFSRMPFYNTYMQLHPLAEDFQYTFNSWGFRADYNYEDLNVDGKKAKIILAIGDSFTMNVGGPLEHSWPSQLQERVNLPVLNGGVDGLGPDSYHLIVDKMRKYFDVQHTFCLLNLHGGATADQLADANCTEQKIHILKSYEWPHGSEIAFIPPWCWDMDMQKILFKHFPDAHAYMRDYDFKYKDIPYDLFTFLIMPKYREMANAKWPSLEAIYHELAMHNHLDNVLSDVDRYFFLKLIEPLCKSYFYRNRDYRHMSKMSNQMVSDYFFDKIKTDSAIIKK